MTTISKILVSVGTFFVFGLIFGSIVISNEQAGGKGAGPLGLILTVGLIAGLRAIWKYKKPENQNTDIDKHTLNKN